MDTPLVSIWTRAYNHAPYIRKCLEGVLMQRTTFPFEYLVYDDASTDGTADIIREYEARYPDVVKPIYQTENQFSTGKKVSSRLLLPRTQGKYIAKCEGDDYWTDPLKLQKQVDFLETHPDYTICGGMFRELYEGASELTARDDQVEEMAKFPQGKTVTLQNYFEPYMLQTLTVCFRRDCYQKAKEKYKNIIKYSKDDTLYAQLLEQGNGFVFPDFFGVYRRLQGGIWAGMTPEQRLRSNINYLGEMFKHFGNKSESIRWVYFRNCIDLRVAEMKTSKHFLTDFIKMALFTFSGNIKDLRSFKIQYFYSESKKILKLYCRKLFNYKKTVQNED